MIRPAHAHQHAHPSASKVDWQPAHPHRTHHHGADKAHDKAPGKGPDKAPGKGPDGFPPMKDVDSPWFSPVQTSDAVGGGDTMPVVDGDMVGALPVEPTTTPATDIAPTGVLGGGTAVAGATGLGDTGSLQSALTQLIAVLSQLAAAVQAQSAVAGATGGGQPGQTMPPSTDGSMPPMKMPPGMPMPPMKPVDDATQVSHEHAGGGASC